MRAILQSDQRIWELAWGIHLIGSDERCEIRLEPAPGLARVAAVLFRWLDHCVLMGVGTPPGAKIDGRPIMVQTLYATDPSQGVARSLRFQVANIGLELRWEDVPVLGATEEFTLPELESVHRAALALGRGHENKVDPDQFDNLLGHLMARMARAQSARVVRKDRADGQQNRGNTGTIWPPSRSLFLADRVIQLEWDSGAPERVRNGGFTGSLSLILDDLLLALSGGAAAAHGPPAYWKVFVRLPGLEHRIGPYRVFDERDFEHLGLPAGRVRAVQALVATVDGKVEIVDLSDPPQLRVNGDTVRRSLISSRDRVELCGVRMELDLAAGNTDQLAVPPRLFRVLAASADPVSHLARVGLILPSLNASEKRLAHLLCALAGSRAAGVVAGRRLESGALLVTPTLLRAGGDIHGEAFQSCRLFERALDLAAEKGGDFATADALAANEVVPAHHAPRDRAIPLWGALAVFTAPDGTFLAAWKERGRSAFSAADVKLLHVLKKGITDGALLARDQLYPAPRRPDSVRAAGPGWIQVGALRIPLEPIDLIGRNPDADIQLQWDLTVSGRHAIIVRHHSSYQLFDFRSFNGTAVSGKPVSETTLQDGDKVHLGMAQVRFHEPTAPVGRAGAHYLPPGEDVQPDGEYRRQALGLLRLGASAGLADGSSRGHAGLSFASYILGAPISLLEIRADNRDRVRQVAGGAALPASFREACRALILAAADRDEITPSSPVPTVLASALPALSRREGNRMVLLAHRALPFAADRAVLFGRVVEILDRWLFPQDLAAPRPLLPTVLLGKTPLEIRGPTWVGRGVECGVRLDDVNVSRRHVLLIPDEEGTLLAVDVASSLGMTVNGKAVQRHWLADGDELGVGRHRMKCQLPARPKSDGSRPVRGPLADPTRILAAARTLALAKGGEGRLLATARTLRAVVPCRQVLLMGKTGGVLVGDGPDAGPVRSAAPPIIARMVAQIEGSTRERGMARVNAMEDTRALAGRRGGLAGGAIADRAALVIPLAKPIGPVSTVVLTRAESAHGAFSSLELAIALAVLDTLELPSVPWAS